MRAQDAKILTLLYITLDFHFMFY